MEFCKDKITEQSGELKTQCSSMATQIKSNNDKISMRVKSLQDHTHAKVKAIEETLHDDFMNEAMTKDLVEESLFKES